MSTVKRVFFYTVSFITLGIFAGGVGNLLSLCFDIVIKRERWAGFAIGQLSLGLALVIIGGILWFLFWRVIQKQVSDNPEEQRHENCS
jgi:H+/Cl- antiporter ClcA